MNIEEVLPSRSRSHLRYFRECARLRLSRPFSTIRRVLTSDTDDECLPDRPSVLSIPYDVAKRRNDNAGANKTMGRRFSHRLEMRVGERREMYMAGVRETLQVGS
jgi:hypothetical protein